MGSVGHIHFNDPVEWTHECNATWHDAEIDATVDVTPLLRNGRNECMITLTKTDVGLEKAGIFTAELIIEYSGVPPNFTEPEEPGPPFPWELALLLGIGVITIIGVAVYMEESRRRELMMLMGVR